MSSSNLIRWGGLVIFLGGVLWAIQDVAWGRLVGNQHPYPQPAATKELASRCRNR